MKLGYNPNYCYCYPRTEGRGNKSANLAPYPFLYNVITALADNRTPSAVLTVPWSLQSSLSDVTNIENSAGNPPPLNLTALPSVLVKISIIVVALSPSCLNASAYTL